MSKMANLKNEQLSELTGTFIAVRNWEKNNLPNSQSTLSVEIFLLIAHQSVSDKPLTLKQIFYSLEYSEAGIRKQLKKLIDDNWCYMAKISNDKRLKYVIASDKMIIYLDSYTLYLSETLLEKLVIYKSK